MSNFIKEDIHIVIFILIPKKNENKYSYIFSCGPSKYYVKTLDIFGPFLNHPPISAKIVLNLSKNLPFSGPTNPYFIYADIIYGWYLIYF